MPKWHETDFDLGDPIELTHNNKISKLPGWRQNKIEIMHFVVKA